ncbi:hypothetical protein E4U42_002853 [Claviceps africana]|uniref:Peptidase A1 domain-containing protein n=1 Tax=Claviceps africana TaxID=83212 RepID=A0A8K0JAD2_9HYPO|nr:hypothetical protein E4U42_002853 [Claviceps africana]
MKLFGLAAIAASSQALALAPGAFSVDTLASRGPRLFDTAVERSRLLSKYETTDDEHGSAVKRSAQQHGSVIIEASDDGSSYLVPTVIGNQTLNLIYDTGSADLWVYSNATLPNESRGHNVYVPSSSASSLPGYSWSIKYSSGISVNGTVYTDTVKAGPVVATKQAVEAAVRVPYDVDADGIMGLASGAINQVQPVKQTTFFETILPTLPKKVFAASFQTKGPGSWDFGFLDPAKYKGEIRYANVLLPFKHWRTVAGQYSVGDGPLSGPGATIGNVTFDSGSELLYLPDAVVDAYYARVEGFQLTFGGFPAFPCGSTLPDLHFQVGDGINLTVPGANLNMGHIDRTSNRCTAAVTNLGIMKSSVLGNVFFKNYYVVHSFEDGVPKLGFGSR